MARLEEQLPSRIIAGINTFVPFMTIGVKSASPRYYAINSCARHRGVIKNQHPPRALIHIREGTRLSTVRSPITAALCFYQHNSAVREAPLCLNHDMLR